MKINKLIDVVSIYFILILLYNIFLIIMIIIISGGGVDYYRTKQAFDRKPLAQTKNLRIQDRGWGKEPHIIVLRHCHSHRQCIFTTP